MKITLWGTRGSFPTTNQHMTRYGGNTTCVEVRTAAGDIIILDAGTGIRALGSHIQEEKGSGKCYICFTHKHWDHIHGLISFTPLYNPNWSVDIFGPKCDTAPWQQLLETIFSTSHFPLSWDKIQQKNSIKEFSVGDSFDIGSAHIETCPSHHPNGCVAYKITADGWTFFFSGDHEWTEEGSEEQEALLAFMAGSNVILADAHFQKDAYVTHVGWGHSTMEQWIEHAIEAKVNRLVFTHYHPDCTDDMLEDRLDTIWRERPDLPMELSLAYEGMCIHAGAEYGISEPVAPQSLCHMCNFSHEISRYADSSLILESVLSEARRIGKADAGTIYLVRDNEFLAFSYAQNETLFPGSEANKMSYLDAVMPLSESSIAGYVAITSMPLNIPNVHCIPENVSYKFNDSFDKSSGYKTTSMLTVPLLSSGGNRVVGVLQLINSLQNGNVYAFTMSMQNRVEQLAVLATQYIERSQLSNQLITRMFETSALNDPTETAGHVMRVGAMAAELFHHWAEKNNIPFDELRTTKDTIRLAAMMHDVGKVGIPDAVLKKPGRLDYEEFEIIKQHCILGAGLFKPITSHLDKLAYNIALHHHQKWNGKGYGDPNKRCLSGLDIPLEARITSIADVYDAIVSKRCYKEAVSTDIALDILRKESGVSFDPELIEVFMNIIPTIQAIYNRFED